MCKERNIKPRKSISGKLSLRMPPALHARVSAKAQVESKPSPLILNLIENA